MPGETGERKPSVDAISNDGMTKDAKRDEPKRSPIQELEVFGFDLLAQMEVQHIWREWPLRHGIPVCFEGHAEIESRSNMGRAFTADELKNIGALVFDRS
jgi:hypothetical protein